MEKRDTEIKIRTTKKEKIKIQKNAKRCGLSVTKYLINLANNYQPKEIPSDNFYSTCNYLRELLEIYEGETDENFNELLKEILSKLYSIYIESGEK